MDVRTARNLHVLLVALLLVAPSLASGQGRPHRAGEGAAKSVAVADPLQSLVTLTGGSMRLGEALAGISHQADLLLVYGSDLVPVDKRISIEPVAMPAREALRRVLAGTGVEFTLMPDRQVILMKAKRRPRAERPVVQAGRVTGRVTDALTGAPVAVADVWLEGTQWRTLTSADGRYLLTGVTAGEYTLRVSRLGYASASQAVRVVAGETAVVDVELRSAPTQLDRIVATVTGEQRVRELGHVVGQIKADSLVKVAPVSTVSELLAARVPGLQVFQTSGTVGGEVTLRVRSATSLELNPEPIVIVDGVRYQSGTIYGTTATYGHTTAGPFNVEPTSRLNDLNPNDIESIEVVKGPSAAALYGTDAANGVIVITTKRGRPGPPRWNAYVRAGFTEIPDPLLPEAYWGWSSGSMASCTLRNQARGTCVQDSVTVLSNPINDPELTIFARKPRWQYGVNVSGGGTEVQYYFSADVEEATGPISLPRVLVDELKGRLGGGKPLESQIEPNHQKKINLRGNVTTQLGTKATARLSVGYTQGATRQLSFVNPYNTILNDINPFMEEYTDPIDNFARSSTEWVNRFSGSATLELSPLSWLRTRATIGLDLPSTQRYSLAQRDAWEGYTGTVADERNRAIITTGELGATATFRRNLLTSRTSVGAQYVRNYGNRLIARGEDLRPGGTSVIDASSVTVNHYYNETVTLGTYLEQQFGYDDRFFITGALRADGASTFGNDFQAAVYPKFGVSWVISEEPWLSRFQWMDNLRLRYAFGASGQQPRPDMRRHTIDIGQAVVDGATVTKASITRLPSRELRPERVREHEFGVDATALDGRLSFDLTWNRRAIIDQIRSVSLPAGFGQIWSNLGYATAKGFEAQVAAVLIDHPALSWEVGATHATNTTKIIDLGGVLPDYSVFGSIVEGFPFGARFMRPLLSYEDANGNGIIEEDEIVMGDTAVYVGRGTPGVTQTLLSTIGLFGRRVRISALLDRQTDFVQYNLLLLRMRSSGTLRGAVDPTAPLSEQAKVMASWAGAPAGQSGTAFVFLEPGDFIRLREVSFSLNVPDHWARAARLRNAMLTVSGRNLALWAPDYTGDPESARFRGYFGANGDNIPQARSWTVRVDLGF